MKTIILFIGLAALIGCKSLTPVIITETEGGEKMTVQEVQKTGDRNDVPVMEKASNVVSTATFSHAGGHVAKVIVVKKRWNPFATPRVYFNCIDCHTKNPEALGLTVEQPKDPWYKWPSIFLILAAISALVLSWAKVKTFLAPVFGVLGIFKRIFKK